MQLRLRFNVLSIDYVRVRNCFCDYDYIGKTALLKDKVTIAQEEKYLTYGYDTMYGDRD